MTLRIILALLALFIKPLAGPGNITIAMTAARTQGFDIGPQPLGYPVAMIGATMRRDHPAAAARKTGSHSVFAWRGMNGMIRSRGQAASRAHPRALLQAQPGRLSGVRLVTPTLWASTICRTPRQARLTPLPPGSRRR